MVKSKNSLSYKTKETKSLVKYYVLPWIIIGFAVGLRFFLLSNQSFWIDEGLTLNRIEHDSIQKVVTHLKGQPYDKYQPIYFLLLFWWRSIFGDTEFALRSMSALLGSSCVIIIYLITLKLYGKNHAFWSLIIASFSSFSIYYSQEARPYAWLMFLGSLQIYFFYLVLIKKHKFDRGLPIWGFWVVTLLGILSSIFLNIFTIALGLSDLIVYKNFRRWLKMWTPFIVLGFLTLLFVLTSYPAIQFNINLINHRDSFIFVNLIFVLYGILVGTTYGWSLELLQDTDRVTIILSHWPQLFILLLVLFLIFIPLVLGLFKNKTQNKHKQSDIFFICLFLILLLLGFLFAAVTRIGWIPRHSFYLFIPLVAILPSAFSSRYKINLKHNLVSLLAKCAVVTLVLCNIYSLNNYYFDRSYSKDDYRSTAQYLLKNNNYDSESILLGGKFSLFAYYGNNKILDGSKLKPMNLAREVYDLTQNSNTVFLVINREGEWTPNSNFSVEQAMSNLYTLKSETSFPYFKIYRFTRNKEQSG